MQHHAQTTALLALAALAGCELEPIEEPRAAPVELISEADGERVPIPPAPASLRGVACQSACNMLIVAGCYEVSTACAAATAITLGGLSIPCVWATAVACFGGAAVGGPACGEICGD